MKAFYPTLLFCLLSVISLAQTNITGTIKTTKGLPLANANVQLKGSYDGASSDAMGTFNFSTTEKGTQTIICSALNYASDSMVVELSAKTMVIKFQLKAAENQLQTVTISAGSFVAGDGKKGAVLSALDIATTAGTRADVFAALQTLPGTQVASSESGLFVRGGAAAETKTYFDGLLVKSPFNATVPDQASRGRLSPFLFKGTSFSAGGYSAQYGQALSSALVLESTDLPEKTTTGISLLSVGAGIDQNIRYKNSALTLGGYYYNLSPVYNLIKQETNFLKAPEQLGGNIHYKLKISETGMLKVYVAYSKTKLSLIQNDISSVDNQGFLSNNNDNTYINATYKEFLNDKWKLEAGFAYNKDGDEGVKISDDYSRGDHLMQEKLTLTHYYGKRSNIKFGLETFATGREESFAARGHEYKDQISSGFAESDLFLSDKLVVRLGLRTEYSSYLQKYNLAPRTSLGIKTGLNDQISMAYGRFYQNPEDEYLIIKPLDFEQADHYILKYERNTPERNFRVEAFYKDYKQLTKIAAGIPENTGDGYAQGFEFFWRDKKSIKDADFWVSYSFLDTKRNFRDFPTAATPSFAAKHTASVVFKKFVNAINTQVGAAYSFASGRTYFNPNNPVYLADKTKSYNNLSLTVSHLTHVLGQFTVLYVNANNVPGFKNIYGYNYNPDGLSRQAKLPAARRDIFVGLLMTIGDDTFVR
jgi:hypothetical protein